MLIEVLLFHRYKHRISFSLDRDYILLSQYLNLPEVLASWLPRLIVSGFDSDFAPEHHVKRSIMWMLIDRLLLILLFITIEFEGLVFPQYFKPDTVDKVFSTGWN